MHYKGNITFLNHYSSSNTRDEVYFVSSFSDVSVCDFSITEWKSSLSCAELLIVSSGLGGFEGPSETGGGLIGGGSFSVPFEGFCSLSGSGLARLS